MASIFGSSLLVAPILTLDRGARLSLVKNVLDDALDAISHSSPNLDNGNTNHAPMVAETLVAIGREDAVQGWVEAYRRDAGTQDRPSERPPLTDWRESLGNPRLWPEWVGLFQAELAEEGWQEVLDAWAARLAPGLSGAATHGLIRTAHAARALSEAETRPRLNELADGLAYWAATYHDFGSVPGTLIHYPLDEALDHVPDLNPPLGGNIDQALVALDGSDEFVPVINLLRTGKDPLADLSALTERFAGVYLSNAHDPARVFAVVHAVTGPSALRLLAPHVTKSTQSLLLLYAWQTAAAIYGVWGKDHDPPDVPASPPDSRSLTEASVANGAAHAIKFVEACLREYEVNPSPVYLAAAQDAAGRLTG
jgi:hypothetical protein